MNRRDRDRGVADALGLVLIAPVAIGLAVLVVLLGRSVDARAQIRSAAAAGAQAAALERNAADAERAASAVITAMLVDTDACAAPSVAVDHPPAPVPGSATTLGTVRVTVRCTVSDRGVELVAAGPSDEAFSATATVDFFRARGGP